MKNNNVYLRDENILTLLSLNNLIVPEIQREYVWGMDENEKVLNNFLNSIKENANVCEQCRQVHKSSNLNVGFLYSYKPSYVTIENERYLDEFIIDGQQRVTTLFLLLLYLAVKEKRVHDFISLVRFNKISQQVNFDYKVRYLTHCFTLDFLSYLNNNDEIKVKISDIIPTKVGNSYYLEQTWFLSDYKSDITIQAMLGALNKISAIFNNNYDYFDYVLNSIRFWHFKTEATSQGEELYITMNSRGEKLERNEEEKALLLPQDELLKYGQEWEWWQDFFWKNKQENRNSDNGFNEFIECIKGLWTMRKRIPNSSDKGIEISNYKIYIEAFKWLMNHKESYKEKYVYNKWVDECMREIWEIINLKKTNWSIDCDNNSNYANQSTERNRTILIWSWLHYYEQLVSANKNVDEDAMFRLLRMFYVRYKNFNRSATTLLNTINTLINTPNLEESNEIIINNSNVIEDDVVEFRSEEETLKWNIILNYGIKAEELIWEIEDHEYNIDGRDVGAINISHLIDLKNATTDNLRKCCDKFKELMLEDKKILQTTLLFYGNYQVRVSPWYYFNFDHDNWKKIIRGRREGHEKSNAFKEFWNDYLHGNKNLLQILHHKESEWCRNSHDFSELNDRLIAYWLLIKYYPINGINNDMWVVGNNMAFSPTDQDSLDRIFKNNTQIHNIKRYYKGNCQLLSGLVNTEIIEHLKNSSNFDAEIMNLINVSST